ncbi:MAG TPA: 6-phosphogluconolactonase [Rubrobacteraceae bacterium]|nr:6-phosphogluconolactonase [Rubrobacteraceae bacterium]
MSPPNVHVFETPQALAEAVAGALAEEAARSTRERGRFAVALAGGSTPKRAYELLATRYRDALDWSKVHVFFGDERAVPPDHEDSNYRMAQRTLLSGVPVGSVHRMRGELDPREAAALYEEELKAFFDGPPSLDLILLGIGEDGHTASLFPHTPALDVSDRWVVENPVEKLGTIRITLTFPAINAARKATFLVTGEGKAEALREILEGDSDPHDYPAKLVRPVSDPVWMLDRAAARLLD